MSEKKILEEGITLFAKIDKRQHEAIRALAFEDDCTITEITRRALDMYIESRENELERKRVSAESHIPKD